MRIFLEVCRLLGSLSHIYLFDSILAYPIQLYTLKKMNVTYDNEYDVERMGTKPQREN